MHGSSIAAILILLNAVLLSSADSAEATEVIDCRTALETLYGETFSDCTPYVSGDMKCYGYGGIPVICASATATVQYKGDSPISNICPDGIGDPPPPSGRMQSCWLLEDTGWGFGLLPGIATTKGVHSRSCLFDAAQSCVNDYEELSVGTETSVTQVCHTAQTVTWMAGGMTWAYSDQYCAQK